MKKSAHTLRLENLAHDLGVRKIVYAASRTYDNGEYVRGFILGGWSWQRIHLRHDWRLSHRQVVAHIRREMEIHKRPVIFSTHDAIVLSHEIGHHISYLAHEPELAHETMTAKTALYTAFQQHGLSIYPKSLSELRAELMGKYLDGRKLNVVLLRACERILKDLPATQAEIIRKFREGQSQQTHQSRSVGGSPSRKKALPTSSQIFSASGSFTPNTSFKGRISVLKQLSLAPSKASYIGAWFEELLGELHCDWILTKAQDALIRREIEKRRRAIILTNGSALRDREIGRHIFQLAHGTNFGIETINDTRLHKAFRNSPCFPCRPTLCEVMAGTLGSYIGGESLNQILLAAVDRVLKQLPEDQASRIRTHAAEARKGLLRERKAA